ncbi:MAG: HAD hydrolase-like protein [Cytophagaceae bacterium]|nr:HAD hydrolase-like protein [Cytophagaceae bacterium]
MSNIKMVAFDMAGTTVRDQKEVETCFAMACVKMGLKTSVERILSLQGYAKREVFNLLWSEQIGSSDPNLKHIVDESYLTFCEILEDHYHHSEIVPTDYTLEVFEYLKSKDIKIALTTGFYRKVANIILEKLGWLQDLDNQYIAQNKNAIIDISVTPDEVIAGRPNPAMLIRAMQVFGIKDPFEVINIGDTPVDILFGKNASVKYAFAVTNGTHSESQLTGLGADALLKNIGELKMYI